MTEEEETEAIEEALKPKHRCSICGLGVIVLFGQIYRACPHSDAGVVAEMQARAIGHSTLEQQGPKDAGVP